MELTEGQIKDYADKLGNEELEITAAILVKVLNEKHGGKKSGNPFQFSDIQQYYIRGSVPNKYGGYKIKLNTTILGKTLTVFKKEEKA